MTEMRPAIIKLHEKGKSVREIEELLDVPKSTVQYHIKHYEETGSHKNKPKRVRKEGPKKALEIGKTSSVPRE
jgi:transposase